MRGLDATRMLGAWESGRQSALTERALALLAAAWPGESRETLSHLPIGVRDSRLLSLREAVFGPRLESIVRCPSCHEMLTIGFEVSDVRVTDGLGAPALPVVRQDGYEVRFRLPTSQDLATVDGSGGVARARRLLLELCVESALRNGEPEPPAELPETVVGAVVAAMEQADPQANIELSFDCPECRHRWASTLDIASYLWTEVDGWAQRTLYEIHSLASAYGWREQEILGLSARRRRDYMELIGR